MEISEAKVEAESAKQEVQGMRKVISSNANKWRSDINNIIAKMAIQQGGSSEAYRGISSNY